MRKKLLVVILSLSMCMSTGAVAFADESGDEIQNQAERDARVRVTFVWRNGGKNSAYIARKEEVKWI